MTKGSDDKGRVTKDPGDKGCVTKGPDDKGRVTKDPDDKGTVAKDPNGAGRVAASPAAPSFILVAASLAAPSPDSTDPKDRLTPRTRAPTTRGTRLFRLRRRVLSRTRAPAKRGAWRLWLPSWTTFRRGVPPPRNSRQIRFRSFWAAEASGGTNPLVSKEIYTREI